MWHFELTLAETADELVCHSDVCTWHTAADGRAGAVVLWHSYQLLTQIVSDCETAHGGKSHVKAPAFHSHASLLENHTQMTSDWLRMMGDFDASSGFGEFMYVIVTVFLTLTDKRENSDANLRLTVKTQLFRVIIRAYFWNYIYVKSLRRMFLSDSTEMQCVEGLYLIVNRTESWHGMHLN